MSADENIGVLRHRFPVVIWLLLAAPDDRIHSSLRFSRKRRTATRGGFFFFVVRIISQKKKKNGKLSLETVLALLN